MRAILGDINIQGQVASLMRVLEGPYWGDVWADLKLSLRTFRDLGLEPQVADSVLWRVCQQEQILLITANRNADGPDSLEATLRTSNTSDSLPIFTVGDAERLRNSSDYAENVVERLLECLIDIDNYRGTGRIYLP